MGTGFSVDASNDGPTTTIRVAGELDLATSPQLQAACATAIERRPTTLRIDMSEVTFLDSTGISVLVQAHKQLEAEGGTLVLYGLNDHARRVLDVAGLGAFFRVSDERSA
jgi:anti-sigma B factor antagonist